MGGAASKAKGSSFEREICTKLSLWITGGKRKDCFWRSAMSGGRATVARKRGKDVRQAGDITAVAPEGHALTNRVYIECKHYKDLQIDSFILQDKGVLASFWHRACTDADERDKAPWLIVKQNRRPTLLIIYAGSPWFTPIEPICSVRHWTHIHLLDRVLEKKPPKEFQCLNQSYASILTASATRTRAAGRERL